MGTGGITSPSSSTPAAIAAVSAAWAATPYLSGNSVQYFCDCTGPGATCALSGASSGDDANPGTELSPKKTINTAINWLNGGLNRTVALCQGGSFTPATVANYALRIGNVGCTAGSTCNELREYPVGGTGAKPIINNLPGQVYLFFVTGSNIGGLRILNLKLQGVRSTDGTGLNWGMLLFAGSHDYTFGNVTFDSFDMALYAGDGATTPGSNLTVTGSEFNNIQYMGFLGVANNLKLDYNSFINSGGDSIFDHAIYTGADYPVSGIEIVGNYVSGFSSSVAAQNTQCLGVEISGGGEESNIVVSGNVLVQNSATVSGGCYGIAFGNHGYPVGGKLHNLVISGNTIINGGNTGIGLQTCNSGCVVKDNLIYTDVGGVGINTALSAARTSVGACTSDSPVVGVTCADEQTSGAVVVNNTIYTSPSVTGGFTGVEVGTEGTGYVIANNSVTMMQATNTNPASCFAYGLAPAAYSYINMNHCYAVASHNWELHQTATLATWQSGGFDINSIENPPEFVNPTTSPYDFHPKSGSPLLRAGASSYAPTTDLSGVSFVNPPAIGAYE